MVELGTRNHFGGGISLSTVRVNGITLRYAECEAKTSLSTVARDAPLILFLHGWPRSWFSWRLQLRALSAIGFHCVAPDMRGYGRY